MASWHALLTPSAILKIFKTTQQYCRTLPGIEDLYPNSVLFLDVVAQEVQHLTAANFEPDLLALQELRINVARRMEKLAADDLQPPLPDEVMLPSTHTPQHRLPFANSQGQLDLQWKRQAAHRLEDELDLRTAVEAVLVQRQRGG